MSFYASYGYQCAEDSLHRMSKPYLSPEKDIMTGVEGKQE